MDARSVARPVRTPRVVKEVRGQIRTDVHIRLGGTGPMKPHTAWRVGGDLPDRVRALPNFERSLLRKGPCVIRLSCHILTMLKTTGSLIADSA